MLKPKLHFSEHVNLTVERFVFLTSTHTALTGCGADLVWFASHPVYTLNHMHLKPVKKCASGGNNKSVERTVMRRLMRIRNPLAQKVDVLPEKAAVRQVADEE